MTHCWEKGDPAPGNHATIKLESLNGSAHFVGIGGIGMSALARLLLKEGVKVSGSDKENNPITEELSALGARIFIGHNAENVEGAALLVVSTAITSSNPELQEAQKRNLPIMHRSTLLHRLTEKKKLLAVSGTHGKTTTTGMLAQLLLDANLDPTVVVGGVFPRVGSNAVAGDGEYFVAEADESDKTHACMKSQFALITNIEADHLENYPGGMSEIYENMLSFANNAQSAVVLCLDDAGCRHVLDQIKPKIISYGTEDVSPNASYVLKHVDAYKFSVRRGKDELGEVALSVPGAHNKLNALGALVIADQIGIPFKEAAASMSQFSGVARRFQVLGTASGITVVDDYGHHPTEVRATLEAAQQYKKEHGLKGRVIALFQPHQPGRLRDLWSDFCGAFQQADVVLLADIYVARGGNIDGISSERFAKEIQKVPVQYMPGQVSELADKVAPLLKAGDLVLTIGAGDITKVGPELLKRLR